MSKENKTITELQTEVPNIESETQLPIIETKIKKPNKKNDKFDFNNKDLKIWLSANYPKSIIFEFERGNLPYYIFETYLQSIK